jgi:hypothetical protein
MAQEEPRGGSQMTLRCPGMVVGSPEMEQGGKYDLYKSASCQKGWHYSGSQTTELRGRETGLDV